MDQSCPVCSQKYASDDVIPLNGTPEQQTQLRAQLPFRKSAGPAKPKKRKASAEPDREAGRHGSAPASQAKHNHSAKPPGSEGAATPVD